MRWRASCLLGRHLLEVAALRIGAVDPRRVHVDRDRHRMGVEGGMALLDDAAQQDDQGDHRSANGHLPVELEASLTCVTALQPGNRARRLSTPAPNLFGGRVSHTALGLDDALGDDVQARNSVQPAGSRQGALLNSWSRSSRVTITVAGRSPCPSRFEGQVGGQACGHGHDHGLADAATRPAAGPGDARRGGGAATPA